MTPLERRGWASAAADWIGQTRVGRIGPSRVLVALFEAGGRVVSVDELRSAAALGAYTDRVERRSIKVYICELRGALSDLGHAAAIETVAPGYRLKRTAAAAIDEAVRAFA